MKLKIVLSVVFLSASFSWINAQDLIGWASQNGGTTGGLGGDTVTVTTRNQFTFYTSSTAAYVIQVQDTIELNLYEMIPVKGNKTIVGLGYNAAIRYGGLRIEGNNVIIQNLEIFDTYDGDWGGTSHSTDGITVYGAKNVWIDHCWLHACADGLLDIRSNGPNNIGDFVTVSYTRFTDHNKVTLVGSSDDNTYNRGHLRTTFHHCWYDGTIDKGVNQRMPRVRFGDVHVLNNYYEKIGSYCVAARFESDVVVENCYFRNSGDPHIIDDVGLGTEDPDLVAVGNVYEYCDNTQETNGTAFDPAGAYAYAPDPVMEVPAAVMNGAGRFDPPGNMPPVAVADLVQLANLTSLVVVDVVDNDTDADGGDLRIATVLNDPDGEAGVRANSILYRPSASSTQNDTLFYQLVDTQGGVDTGMVIFWHPLNSTKDRILDDAALKISPNPVSGEALIEFNSELPEKVEIHLFDLAGRKYDGFVSPQSASGGNFVFSLNTNGLPAGNYFVQARQGQWLASERVVVVE